MLCTRLLIVIAMAVLPRLATAGPSCQDPSALRTALEGESARADHWNLAWRITYTALAAGQIAGAASGSASHDDTRTLWVGGVKSALGAAGAWLSPLRIHVPPMSGEACDDGATLRAVAERAASDERIAFWTSHIAGLIVNLAGAAVVAELTSWKTGLVSFALGYPIGLISTYTMPRASWRRVREPSWTAGVVATPDHYALVVGGAF